MSIETTALILKQYGPLALLLIVFIFILVRGQISFRYPRHK
jgi:hypothetical protein